MKFLIFTILVFFSTVHSNELPCNCRLGSLNRIVNGQISPDHSIPWIASLAEKQLSFEIEFCGATIINEKYVFTAAHCVENKYIKAIRVRVGIKTLDEIPKNRVYSVRKIITDNKNQKKNDYSDFALLELEDPIKFIDNEIEPACLNFEDENFSGDILTAGWGLTGIVSRKTNSFGPSSGLNKKTKVLKYYFGTQNSEVCQSNNICVKANNNGDSICFGDAGGPLMHVNNGKTSIIGMSSKFIARQKDSVEYHCIGDAEFSRIKIYKDLVKKHVTNYCSA